MPLGKPPKYYDYEAYVQKFQKKAATTDDTFTPEELYRDLLAYVDQRIFPLDGYTVERPFVPGGDYLSYPYTDRSVVIDNPPFSILHQILTHYRAHGIRYFLFCPILTARPDPSDCLIYGPQVEYTNKANVKTGFRTNLIPGVILKSDPELYRIIDAYNQRIKPQKKFKKPIYPDDVFTVATLGKFAGIPWELKTEDCHFGKTFHADDGSPADVFGTPFRVPIEWARDVEREREREREREGLIRRLVWRDDENRPRLTADNRKIVLE